MGLIGNNSTCGGCCTNTTRLCHSAAAGWEAARPAVNFAALLYWAGISERSGS